ncbi:hypothetical protein EV652_111275 [Kribbella steppae]|uniref:Membrane protein ArfC n=1 Tax=Kribbella steppae TaxID=2512223 RepID=A0A4R2H7L2_9ACTN|nr:hypothetical protein [Kribbella steppae]TCO21364.1 hypothetical protein EV652_111275 [Kribbella steppae]
MSWLLRHNWLWSLLAFLLGAAITWILLTRREQPAPAVVEESVEEEVLVGASVGAVDAPVEPRPSPVEPRPAPVEPRPAPVEPRPAPVADVPREPEPAFNRRMDADRTAAPPTLFDVDDDTAATEPQVQAVVPPGRYGEGSAEAVPHQGPPDGFTIKGNTQSKLFHTPDSPYYGRTKPEVWFRSEADAERAGFTKYTRRPRKSANPRD